MTVHAEDMPVYTLDQVVVTANREPEKVIDSNADISVVTAKDIEANHYKSVADAVKQVPGVVIATRGSSSQTYFSDPITINGSTNVVVMVDGMRVNTNGLADCITGRNAAPEMHGLLDIVSVSLNAPTAEKYDAVCHSKYGPEAFDAMLHFTAEAVKNVPHVVMTVVSTMPAEDIEACRKLCENAGAKFRVREYISE